MAKTRVCIVAPIHRWDDVRVFQKEASCLVANGYQVHLIAKTNGRFSALGVDVYPVVGRLPKLGLLGRLLSLPTLVFQAFWHRGDIYHLHNPDTLLVAIMLRFFGKKVIYDTHEDFGKRVLMRDWIPPFLRGALAKLVVFAESFVSRLVNGCIGTQPGVVQRLTGDVILLGNPPRVDSVWMRDVNDASLSIVDDHNGLRVVYVGEIAKTRCLLEMVDALSLANVDAPVRLWLVGSISDGDYAEVSERPGWRYVDYLGRLPQREALARVLRADVGLAVLKDIGDYSQTDPNKLYEYLAFRTPFIASNFPLWRNRFDEEKPCGWFVGPGDVEGMAGAFIDAFNDVEKLSRMAANGVEFVRLYNWGLESDNLLALYKRILVV